LILFRSDESGVVTDAVDDVINLFIIVDVFNVDNDATNREELDTLMIILPFLEGLKMMPVCNNQKSLKLIGKKKRQAIHYRMVAPSQIK